jgi:hypothetical protein
MPPPERETWLAGAAELIQAGTTPAEFPVHVVIGLTSLEAS